MAPADVSSFLLEPEHSLETLADRERDLKVEYLKVQIIPRRATPHRGVSRAEWLHIVDNTKKILETTLAVAGFAEAARELGHVSTEAVRQNFDQVRRLAANVVGRDPVEVVRENADFVQQAASAGSKSHLTDWNAAFDVLVQGARALVSIVPIDDVSTMSSILSRPELGHQCRVAHSALRAFVRRCNPSVKASTRAAGRAYAQGRLTAAEVALLLDLSPEDALVMLEEQGFHRPPEVILLTDEQRHDRLNKIRADRLARRGAPAPSPAMVVRDVIANQRIEGVDARQ